MDQSSISLDTPKAVQEDRAVDTSAIKGLVWGFVVDFIGSTATSTIAIVLYFIDLTTTGKINDSGDINKLLQAFFDTKYGLTASAIGCIFSIVGGFVCSRIARHNTLKLGVIFASASAVLGLLLAHNLYNIERNIFVNIATFVSIMIGYVLGQISRNNGGIK